MAAQRRRATRRAAIAAALALLALAAMTGLGLDGSLIAAAPPFQLGNQIDPTQALAAADPVADGPPAAGVLIAGTLLLLGLALSTRRGT